MEEILKLVNVSFKYDKENYIFKNVNATFKSSKCYGIFGKSGAGKSTLLSIVSGLEKLKEGDIYYKEKNIKNINLDKFRCTEIGIIFQSYNLLPQLTAIENITIAMDLSKNKLNNREKEKKAEELLESVGIDKEKGNKRILMLSGGEQQRVAIARALSYDANIILADEPTGNLDPDTEDDIINLLLDLSHKHNKCVIIISHSRSIRKKVDEIYNLKDKKLILEKKS